MYDFIPVDDSNNRSKGIKNGLLLITTIIEKLSLFY